MALRFVEIKTVLQEVPGELSLCFTISGCPLRCPGCHSAYLRKKDYGKILSPAFFNAQLNKYDGLISNVLFMGGEWEHDELKQLLILARSKALKTTLYTGQDWIETDLLQHLDYVKFGPYISSCGSLTEINTNQRFIEIETNRALNHLFQNL